MSRKNTFYWFKKIRGNYISIAQEKCLHLLLQKMCLLNAIYIVVLMMVIG